MTRTAPLAAAAARSGRMASRSLQRGFTLIELMVAVAVVAILSAIAYPAYTDYVRRGQLVDATNLLSTFQVNMERHFQDNRDYRTVGTFTTPCEIAVAQRTAGPFVLSCASGQPTATTYTLQAVGLGYTFTLTQANVRATTAAPSGWGTCATSWIVRRGQTC